MSSSPTNGTRPRSGTASSLQSASRTVKNAGERILDADLPLGMWAATANATATAPTMTDIRRGSFGHGGWDAGAQQDNAMQRQQSQTSVAGWGARRPSSAVLGGSMGRTTIREESLPPQRAGAPVVGQDPRTSPGHQPIPPQPSDARHGDISHDSSLVESTPSSEPAEQKPIQAKPTPPTRTPSRLPLALQKTKSYPSGYIEPPKKPWTESTVIGLKGFWKWFLTPSGFLITLYGANVVAWGGMLFLILLNASPVMCSQNTAANNYDGCNDINSPRRVWIEIDSQILNALFCVTGFGLIPWRFRDLYWLLRWRSASSSDPARKMLGLRKLAGIHNGWFRLPESDTLDENPLATDSAAPHHKGQGSGADSTASEHKSAQEPQPYDLESPTDDLRLPLPMTRAPPAPLTGVRAQPTRPWLMDFVIWCNVWNTFFQAVLCGFMWGMNRYDRPSWATGLFIAIGCIVAGVGGIVMFVQGKRVKRVEGVAPKGYVDSLEEKGGV